MHDRFPRRPLRPATVQRLVAPVAHLVLADDLPGLTSDERDELVAFVVRRVDVLPSVMHLGVMAVAALYRGLLSLPAGTTVVRRLARLPLPLLGEYPRFIRSLAFAEAWESNPDRRADGAMA
jgi:hypothetical protein